jgi:DNA-binding SARP family transcriptional activator
LKRAFAGAAGPTEEQDMAWSVPIRIEVLGAVRAWHAERELPLGPPQQCGVLTLLAIAGGQPLSVQEIVDGLWDRDPPRSAANVVQTYVKRLRKVLEPDRPPRSPSQALPAVNSGYALRVESGAVDLWRFRHLVRLAGDARRACAHEQVVSLLREALDLWKGAPGDGNPALTHHHRIRAVVEEYGTVAGWFAETALIIGAAAEAVPVVAEVAAARPFDEPLHANLMRLYQAAGRRSYAVQVYRDCQGRLRDELGLDPGPELTMAYRELLGEPSAGSEA